MPSSLQEENVVGTTTLLMAEMEGVVKHEAEGQSSRSIGNLWKKKLLTFDLESPKLDGKINHPNVRSCEEPSNCISYRGGHPPRPNSGIISFIAEEWIKKLRNEKL